MAKIVEKIGRWRSLHPGKPFFSLEYFPPRTTKSSAALYGRLDHIAALKPLWIDVTWAAGGRGGGGCTEQLCWEAAKHGLDVMMHLTCRGICRSVLEETLRRCQAHGIRNIMALRGDAPASDAVSGEFEHAVDLVAFIKEEFGDYFCIAVAGYPEVHSEAASKSEDLKYLKEKVDAGADLVVTQFFFDNESFFTFQEMASSHGVCVPIVPGIMPVRSYRSFKRITKLAGSVVPSAIDAELHCREGQDLKEYGVQLAVTMCRDLVANGVPGLHFYTLNNEESALRVLNELGLVENVE
eukprot:TRINITY_DN78308_c0_g1_i1.p1 TRINITY_DN78308_c0_g1~~TRINITY_DN78308_c0_g1_i1.p1  ORF type:complete len:315 (-),score=50.82 TRINITY_DN78308_c0_g1_i1:260-1147(-)